MYQLLSGHLPFWDAASDRSPFAVMSAILNQEARIIAPPYPRPHSKTLSSPFCATLSGSVQWCRPALDQQMSSCRGRGQIVFGCGVRSDVV